MELGIVINELKEHVSVMDAYCYNIGISVDRSVGGDGHSEPELRSAADTDQRLDPRKTTTGITVKRCYDDRFVRQLPPLFIEPVLTSPADYIHLGSLPKRAKLDEYYVRSTVPNIVRDALLRRPHNVVVSDPLNALGGGDDGTLLMKTDLYGPNDASRPGDAYTVRRPDDAGEEYGPRRQLGSATPPHTGPLADPPPPPSHSGYYTPESVSRHILSTSLPPQPPLPPPPPPPPPLPSDANGAPFFPPTAPPPFQSSNGANAVTIEPSLRPHDRNTSGGEVTSLQDIAHARDDLLNSIRRGVTLRPVAERRSPPPSRRVSDRAEVNAMSIAMIQRRSAIDPKDVLKNRFKIMDRFQNDSTDEDNDDASSVSDFD